MTVMENITAQGLKRSGITLKQYVLGRRDTDSRTGTLNIGRYLALDSSLGSDGLYRCPQTACHSHLRQRGYGKSYTMGTMIEELCLTFSRDKSECRCARN